MAESRGDLVEAERALVWVSRLDAGSPYSWLALGRFLESGGRVVEAEEAYREAEARRHDLPEVRLCLGRVLVRTGRDQEARPLLAAASEAGLAEAFAIWGRLELRAADEVAAANVLERWVEDGAAGEHRKRRIELALAVGRFDLAVEDLLILADERRPVDGERLVDAAKHGCRNGSALAWFRSRGAVTWGAPWAQSALALSRNAADESLEGAALRELGAAGAAWTDWLLRRERYEEALVAADGDPYLGGRALRGLERYEEALRLLEQVEDDGMHGIRASAERVDLLLQLERTEEALRVAAEASENPSDPKATAWVWARALAALGRMTEAEDAIGRAWTGAQHFRRIARLRSETGAEVDGIREALAWAVESGSLAAHRELARLEERTGGNALAQWDLLTQRDPDDVDAWVGIARLDPTRRAQAIERALAADACDAQALLEAARDLPACEGLPFLDRAWDASPRRASVLDARDAARAACTASETIP